MFSLLKRRVKKASSYFDDFKDTSYINWKIDGVDKWSITTPNKAIVKFDPTIVDFESDDFLSNVSTKMWMWSLGFLLHINDDVIIERLLSQFKNTVGERSDLYRISSWDHCTAVRINTMLCLIDKYKKGSLTDIAASVLRKDAKAISEDRLAYNNHGMMLAFAGLHTVALRGVNKKERDRLLSICGSFVNKYLDKTFDDQGWSNENTPGYQDFFRKYLLLASNFANRYRIDDVLCNKIVSTQSRVDEALCKVVLPNGNIPPIGESGAYPTRFKSINGCHIFKSSGLYINKNKDTYLAIISGSRSETHKQMDDTSLTLWSRGQYLFVDSGLYNYNVNDSKTRAINSQRGHSGFFFKRFDDLRRPEFKKLYPSYLAKIDVHGDGVRDHIECECSIPVEGLRWLRRIYVENLSRLIIEDEARGEGELVQRFIVPIEANIDINLNESKIQIDNGAASMTMLLERNAAVQIRTGELNPEVCGWRSTGFEKIEKSQVLEITPPGPISRIEINLL